MPLLGGAWCPANTTYVACAEVYLRTKWHLGLSSRLATADIGQKLGGAVPFFLGDLGVHRTQSRVGRAYLLTKWQLSPSSRSATTDIGRKLGNAHYRSGSWVPT